MFTYSGWTRIFCWLGTDPTKPLSPVPSPFPPHLDRPWPSRHGNTFHSFEQKGTRCRNLDKICQLLQNWKIIDGWISGIISIKDLENPFLFVIYTLGIWIAYFANTYILLLAFPASMHLGLDAGLIVLVMGTFGMATPTQGGIGAYHKLVAAALVFYHIPLKEATVLATFSMELKWLRFCFSGD